jgi:hypothetical protein
MLATSKCRALTLLGFIHSGDESKLNFWQFFSFALLKFTSLISKLISKPKMFWLYYDDYYYLIMFIYQDTCVMGAGINNACRGSRYQEHTTLDANAKFQPRERWFIIIMIMQRVEYYYYHATSWILLLGLSNELNIIIMIMQQDENYNYDYAKRWIISRYFRSINAATKFDWSS